MSGTLGPGRRSRVRAFATVAGAVSLGCLLGRDAGPRPPAPTIADVALEVTADGCSGLVPHSGSAVAIGGDLVATMAHVVAGTREITVQGPGDAVHAATIAAIDTQRDVAVLRAPSLHRPRLTFGALAKGDTAAYYGFGGSRPDHEVSVTIDGVVSIISEDIYREGSYPRPGYQFTGAIVPGDSGAGVMTARGALAGLVWAVTRDGDGHGFAVSSDVLRDLLATVGTTAAAPVACT